MKSLVIVGAGLGMDSLTAEGRVALEKAEVWFGAPRLLSLYDSIRGEREAYPHYQSAEIRAVIEKSDAAHFAVLVSGDVGFYSAASGLANDLAGYAVRLVPGISSVNAFFARLGRPWQDSVLWSAHGRDAEAARAALTGLVRRNRATFCLAGPSAAALGTALSGAGFADLRVHVGENLGTGQEKVYTITAETLSRSELPSLCVLLVENDAADDSIPAGISDAAFVRAEGIPMTKSAVRAVSLSRLALKSNETVYDIGAGTGSVTVEMALAGWRGRVYAIEKEDAAPALIQENCRRFHIGNVTVVHGAAPDALRDLPPPDAVFIGGSGGNMGDIIGVIRGKNPAARIVATAITLETAAELLALLPRADLIQVSAAETRKVGGGSRKLHLFQAQNPVMIITAAGAEAE
jgi:precorrin-6Y C5,15-methyltransferase (decarboxylating)